MPYYSKGLLSTAAGKLQELEQALWEASAEGQYPILCDTSPCTLQLLQSLSKPLQIFEPVGFAQQYLLDKLLLTPVDRPVMLHITCSGIQMGLAGAMREMMRRCSLQVIEPEGIHCCGYAGDKGIRTPELNASALRRLKEQVPLNCEEGYSHSRTCEIGLAEHAGIPYRSILYLLDEVSQPQL
ncbi:MAG: hypothetical protein ACRC5A_13720 [Enterobacteriaceae bacterium]